MASESLKSIMSRSHEGQIVLPDFQRDFVWKPTDVIKLIASLLNRYPIGGLLLMENSGVYGYRLLDGVPKQDKQDGVPKQDKQTDVVLVLDGQQRLTSCYRAFYGALDDEKGLIKYPGRYYFNYKEYLRQPPTTSSDVQDLVQFIPAKKVRKLYDTTNKEQAEGLFPLDIVFQKARGTDYSKWLSDFTFSQSGGDREKYEQLSQRQADFITSFIEAITGYQVYYEEIKKNTSSDVICTVFETINTTGKRLTVFDLLVARCFPKNIKLRDMLDDALEVKQMIHRFDPDGEEVCVTALPRIISLLDKGSSRRADMLELKPEVIRDRWDYAINALEMALTILAEKFGCLSLRFVPLIDIVPPMAIIVASEKFNQSVKPLEKLSKWYWRCVFSQYFVSSTETKTARSIREWLGGTDTVGWLDDDSKEPESVKDFSFRSTILDDVSRIDSAIYRGVISFLLSRNVRDFGQGNTKLGEVSSTDIEDHHIYPARFLRPYGVKSDYTNNIANRTPLLGSTNRLIGNDAAHVYLRKPEVVGSNEIDDNVLLDHCIDPIIVKSRFTMDVYTEFIKKRKARLVKQISGLVGMEPSKDDYELTSDLQEHQPLSSQITLTVPLLVEVRAGEQASFPVQVTRQNVEGGVVVSFHEVPSDITIDTITIHISEGTAIVTAGEHATKGKYPVVVMASCGPETATRHTTLSIT